MKRAKKVLWIGALILGALVAFMLIANAIAIRITGSRLEERLSAIRQAGEPVTLADLARPTPRPNENAAVLLGRGRSDMESLTKELNHIDDAFSDDIEDRMLTEEQKAIRATPGGHLQATRKALEAYPRVLPLLEQAAACPDYNCELPYAADPQTLLSGVLPEIQRFRQYINIVRAQASSLRAQGKGDDALRWCLVGLRLTRHLEREPLLISYLVVVACRAVAIHEINATLRSGPISDAIRAELDKELALDEDVRGYQQALKAERAYAISSFGTLVPLNWLNRAFFNNDEYHLIDAINEQLELVSQPYAAIATGAAEAQRQGGSYLHPMATLLVPAMIKTREAMERSRAQVRCLRILNALQQHGPWRNGQSNLAELGLPAETITDPYDGSPIKLKRVGDDWLIYSVGPDLKDDGGQLERSVDIGLGPVSESKQNGK